jgi:hypothetical protein
MPHLSRANYVLSRNISWGIGEKQGGHGGVTTNLFRRRAGVRCTFRCRRGNQWATVTCFDDDGAILGRDLVNAMGADIGEVGDSLRLISEVVVKEQSYVVRTQVVVDRDVVVVEQLALEQELDQ